MSDATGPDAITDFMDLLRLDELDVDLFRGWCHAGAPMRAFGGQVAAQALVAAGRTMTPETRTVHSLHGYFMRPGDPARPLVYQVDRLRDGRSYATRRVTAVQGGKPVFTLSASFKHPEPDAGLARQEQAPLLPGPDAPGLIDPYDGWRAQDPTSYWSTTSPLTLDMRAVPRAEADRLLPGTPGVERQFVWFRTTSKLPDDDPLLHVCALAYLSDLTLASTAALHLQPPTAERREPPRVVMASLDHAMWFHRPFRADRWLLFAQRSPFAGDGRGLAQGDFFTEDGTLVASAVQEVLIRMPRR